MSRFCFVFGIRAGRSGPSAEVKDGVSGVDVLNVAVLEVRRRVRLERGPAGRRHGGRHGVLEAVRPEEVLFGSGALGRRGERRASVGGQGRGGGGGSGGRGGREEAIVAKVGG